MLRGRRRARVVQGIGAGRLTVHQGVPGRHFLEFVEELPSAGAEQLDEFGIELRSAPRPSHADRGIYPTGVVKDHDHIGEVHEPRRDEDVGTLDLTGITLAVPPLKGLRDVGAHDIAEAQPFGQLVCGAPVIVEHRAHGPDTVAKERHTEPCTIDRPTAASNVTDHEGGALDRSTEVDRPDVVLDRGVVAEPLRLLVGVNVASDPCHHRREVDNLPLVGPKPHVLERAEEPVGLAEHMLLGCPIQGRSRARSPPVAPSY